MSIFLNKVITALEMLHANLPPTLAKSQVSSVRKHLKNQLLTLLKHPFAAEQFFTNITTLLTDLGASRDEVMKAMPHYEEMKRKARKKEREAAKAAARAEEEATEAKRQKIDIADDEVKSFFFIKNTSPPSSVSILNNIRSIKFIKKSMFCCFD